MGPLKGVKILEVGGIGPGPFCGMLLADYGAEVLRIDSVVPRDAGIRREPKYNIMLRGRRSATIDLKAPEGRDLLIRLARSADVIFEGFRPGVMEKLGLGPNELMAENPRLVYGRITGWGQSGPLAHSAGHDVNYIALTGALHALGRADSLPTPPLNIVGDYAGGGMLLALGIVSAMFEARLSGKGQVVDTAMLDGSLLLMTMFQGLRAGGDWSTARGSNFLDGSAPYYRVYGTADDKMVAVGCIEPKFYRQMIAKLGLDETALPDRDDRTTWPELAEILAARFGRLTRDELSKLFDGSDCCVTAVLDMDEATSHPQIVARQSLKEIDGIPQSAPAPRFSRTPAEVENPPPLPGADTASALQDWGLSVAEIDSLRRDRIVGGDTPD